MGYLLAWAVLPFALATMGLAWLAPRRTETALLLTSVAIGLGLGVTAFLAFTRLEWTVSLKEVAAFLLMYAAPVMLGSVALNALRRRGRLTRVSAAAIAILVAVAGTGWVVLIYVEGCKIGWTSCP
jgi:hypothetical protein